MYSTCTKNAIYLIVCTIFTAYVPTLAQELHIVEPQELSRGHKSSLKTQKEGLVNPHLLVNS